MLPVGVPSAYSSPLQQSQQPAGSGQRGARRFTAPPQLAIRRHDQARAAHRDDLADDRIITRAWRRHHAHCTRGTSLGASISRGSDTGRRVLSSALKNKHPAFWGGQPRGHELRGHPAPGERDDLLGQPQRGTGPVAPPAVSTGTHDVGHVNHHVNRGQMVTGDGIFFFAHSRPPGELGVITDDLAPRVS
jgi:hypothetical protein